MPVTFEWEPGKYFILRTGEESRKSSASCRQVLMFRPSFTYQDSDGMHVVEWHTDSSEARWKEIQGQAAVSGTQRLQRGS